MSIGSLHMMCWYDLPPTFSEYTWDVNTKPSIDVNQNGIVRIVNLSTFGVDVKISQVRVGDFEQHTILANE